MTAASSPIAAWSSYYVIIGSSAGALTGLMFVVIALGAESRGVRSEEGVRAFGTPVLVHFCQVLFLSAFMSIPGHTISSLALVLGARGLGGVVLAAWVVTPDTTPPPAGARSARWRGTPSPADRRSRRG